MSLPPAASSPRRPGRPVTPAPDGRDLAAEWQNLWNWFMEPVPTEVAFNDAAPPRYKGLNLRLAERTLGLGANQLTRWLYRIQDRGKSVGPPAAIYFDRIQQYCAFYGYQGAGKHEPLSP